MKKLLYEFWGKIFLKGSVESERISSSTSTCQLFRGSVRLLTIFWWRKIYSWACTSSRKTFATWSRREFKRMLSKKISQPVLRSVSVDLVLLRNCSKSKRKSCFGLWTWSTNLSIELWALLTVISQNLWQTHTGWLELEANAARNRARQTSAMDVTNFLSRKNHLETTWEFAPRTAQKKYISQGLEYHGKLKKTK